MTEEHDSNKEKAIQKAVNNGMIYGVLATLIYMAVNYFYFNDDDFGVMRYLLFFVLSSMVITFLSIQLYKPKDAE